MFNLYHLLFNECIIKVILMTHSKLGEFGPILTSLSNPIYIDDELSNEGGRYFNSIATISRLPAFDRSQSITKLIYSKFIVKGVKPVNHDLIIQKLRKNSSQKKERKIEKEATNCSKQIIVREKQKKAEHYIQNRPMPEQSKIFEFSMEKILHRSTKSLSYINKNVRNQSGFQRTSNQSLKRPHSGFSKSGSVKQLSRPQSASYARPVSASSRYKEPTRPQTAFQRKVSEKRSSQYQFEPSRANKILTIADSNPVLKVDYIQKNKKQVSSRKKSIYLTIAQTPSSPQNKSSSKKQKAKEEKEVQIKREVVTLKQREEISQKQKEYLQYMKQNMPRQYQKYINCLACPSQLQEQPSLLSCSLGPQQPITMTAREVEQFEVAEFYHTFLNKCLNIEYSLKKIRRKEQPMNNSEIDLDNSSKLKIKNGSELILSKKQ